MRYSDEVVEFIKGWEGLKLTPSFDPLVPGIVDVGYGHVLQRGEKPRVITEEEAEELLRWDLNVIDDEVDEVVLPDLEQHQFDALLSFVYNLGIGALTKSTLLRYVNSQHFDAAADQFGRWVMAGGRPAQGLVKRRAAERKLWLNADYSGRP